MVGGASVTGKANHGILMVNRREYLLNISVSIDLLLCESNIYITKIVVSLILLYSTT